MEFLHGLELSNIVGFNTTKRLFGSFDERHGSLQISISSFFLNRNVFFLCDNTSLGGFTFNSLLFSSFVLNGESSNKLVGFIGSNSKLLIFNLEHFLHFTNTNSGFQKFIETRLNRGLLDINFIILLFV